MSPLVYYHLGKKHLHLVEAVNNARTQKEHDDNYAFLRAWREGVRDMGGNLDYIAVDMHYIDLGDERDRCCGVLCEWEPEADHAE